MTEILDPHFPSLHRVHPRGWLNDPNGILRTDDGRWHVFFQYNPASARHEFIHWGHQSSDDLVFWREEPLGPVPRPGEADQDGCWSGIGLLDRAGDRAGVPTLVYSGVDGEENQLARVIVSRLDASGTRLVEPGVVAADVPQIPGLIGVRDPFVFHHGGRRWAIQGAGVRGGDGYVPTLPLYACDDLERWEHVGTLLHGDDPIAAEHAPADLWECPQLVQVGQRWVLLLSLWRHPDHAEVSTIQVNYLVGDMVDEADGTPRLVPTGGGRVDLGPDFYAPQAVVDPDGDRVLLWGWSWEGRERTQEQTDDQGWSGTLTFPRELRLVGEELLAVPVRELEALRASPLVLGGDDAGEARLDLPVPARAELRASGPLHVEIVAADGTVSEVAALATGPVTAYLDGSLLELLPEDSAPFTTRLYPAEGSTVRVRGALREAWTLGTPSSRS
jgi:beta-fructofuranosidase